MVQAFISWQGWRALKREREREALHTCAFVKILLPGKTKPDPTFSVVGFICHCKQKKWLRFVQRHKPFSLAMRGGQVYRKKIVWCGNMREYFDDRLKGQLVGIFIPIAVAVQILIFKQWRDSTGIQFFGRSLIGTPIVI